MPCRFVGGALIKHADDAFDDVINLGEITTVFAVVKDSDRLDRQYGFGELEQCHVGSTPRAIDCGEAQTGGQQTV